MTGEVHSRPAEGYSILIDGELVAASPGDTIAATMLAAGKRVLRRDKVGQARGMFCNMGTCFECMVTLGNGARVRACMTDVTVGMTISTASD
jgi:D-hydroxyproline dehydrogenase subunit gamma